jgi:flagellar basal body-associated protein FliL
MRTIVMSILALAIYSFNLMADEPKPAEPTEKQLEAAKEAYAKFGATYSNPTNLNN